MGKSVRAKNSEDLPPDAPLVRLGRDTFTTGHVAQLLGCASRTASKLIDGLPHARVGAERRVRREVLADWCREYGHLEAYGWLAGRRAVHATAREADAQALQAALPGGWEVTHAPCPFAAGALSRGARVLVLCGSLGRGECREALAWLRGREGWPPVLALLAEDDPGRGVWLQDGAAEALQAPCDPARLACAVLALAGPVPALNGCSAGRRGGSRAEGPKGRRAEESKSKGG